MCNAISPERAVIWTLLHEGRADDRLRAEHFTHQSYRQWFAVAHDLARRGAPFREADFAAQGRPLKNATLEEMTESWNRQKMKDKKI